MDGGSGKIFFQIFGLLSVSPTLLLGFALIFSAHCPVYDVEAVDDDPGIRKQCLDELDVLGIQVDNYGFLRSSFPVRVAVHEVLPDCLRQSVFKNSHDVMTSFSVAADE